MHLLNVDTRRLEEFWGDRTPPYAILSHTWGEEEVSFQDLDDPKHKEKLGYAKIEGCCQQAIRDGLNFIWVDTCCIDKRSSAELSEAINSMFRWYGEAQVCYVYLEDVPLEENVCAPNSAFCRSRWFTRGWTLQELIAPVELKFFDKTWGMIFVVNKCKKTENGSYLSGDISGTRVAAVARITGIESWHSYWSLTHDICNDLRGVPLATKLSWISKRSTRRVEDMAYSLLGLLEVSMPLLYGEGDGAFIRLQEEFLKKYFDPSILLWGIGMDRLAIKEFGGHLKPYGLARTPLLFAWARGVLLLQSGKHLGQPSRGIWALTPHGLRVELPLLRIDACSDAYLCVMDYTVDEYCESHRARYFAMPLRRFNNSDVYLYTNSHRPVLLEMPIRWFRRNISKWKTIYLAADTAGYRDKSHSTLIRVSPPQLRTIVNVELLIRYGFRFNGIYPPAYTQSFRDAPSRWVHHIFGRHAVMVLHREQRETLYLLINYSRWEMRCEALICLSPYSTRREAIEIWDYCRTPRKRAFLHTLQLGWHQAIGVGIGNGVQCRVALTYKSRRFKTRCLCDHPHEFQPNDNVSISTARSTLRSEWTSSEVSDNTWEILMPSGGSETSVATD